MLTRCRRQGNAKWGCGEQDWFVETHRAHRAQQRRAGGLALSHLSSEPLIAKMPLER